jgi:hypothetical protein
VASDTCFRLLLENGSSDNCSAGDWSTDDCSTEECLTDECFRRRRSDDWWPDETTKEKEAECRCRKVRRESRRKSCRSLRSRGDQDFRMRSGNKIKTFSEKPNLALN